VGGLRQVAVNDFYIKTEFDAIRYYSFLALLANPCGPALCLLLPKNKAFFEEINAFSKSKNNGYSANSYTLLSNACGFLNKVTMAFVSSSFLFAKSSVLKQFPNYTVGLLASRGGVSHALLVSMGRRAARCIFPYKKQQNKKVDSFF